MHKQRLFVVVAAGLGMLATFMPWVNAPIVGSVAGSQGDGWFTFVIFAAALGLALAKDRSAPVTGGMVFGIVGSGALAALIGIWKIVDFKRHMGSVADESNPFAQALMATVSIGFGLYLVVGAGLAVAIIVLAMKDTAAIPASTKPST